MDGNEARTIAESVLHLGGRDGDRYVMAVHLHILSVAHAILYGAKPPICDLRLFKWSDDALIKADQFVEILKEKGAVEFTIGGRFQAYRFENIGYLSNALAKFN